MCLQATDTITLHASNLKIETKGVAVANGAREFVPVNNVSLSKTEFMYVKSPKKFKNGEVYVLTIPFSGNITNDLVGYYKSSYVDKKTNQTRFVYNYFY